MASPLQLNSLLASMISTQGLILGKWAKEELDRRSESKSNNESMTITLGDFSKFYADWESTAKQCVKLHEVLKVYHQTNRVKAVKLKKSKKSLF